MRTVDIKLFQYTTEEVRIVTIAVSRVCVSVKTPEGKPIDVWLSKQVANSFFRIGLLEIYIYETEYQTNNGNIKKCFVGKTLH